MAQTKWHRNDRLFHQELTTGHQWATRVGERLADCGYPVTVTPMEWRDSLADLKRFRSERDIVVGHPGGPEFIVEVKSRSFVFTDDPRSYPSGMPSAMVDTVEGWDTKTHDPQAVVLVSQATSGMLVVPVRRTRDRWKPVRRWDTKREHWAVNYECPRQLLQPMSALVAYLAGGAWAEEGQ